MLEKIAVCCGLMAVAWVGTGQGKGRERCDGEEMLIVLMVDLDQARRADFVRGTYGNKIIGFRPSTATDREANRSLCAYSKGRKQRIIVRISRGNVENTSSPLLRAGDNTLDGSSSRDVTRSLKIVTKGRTDSTSTIK